MQKAPKIIPLVLFTLFFATVVSAPLTFTDTGFGGKSAWADSKKEKEAKKEQNKKTDKKREQAVQEKSCTKDNGNCNDDNEHKKVKGKDKKDEKAMKGKQKQG